MKRRRRERTRVTLGRESFDRKAKWKEGKGKAWGEGDGRVLGSTAELPLSAPFFSKLASIIYFLLGILRPGIGGAPSSLFGILFFYF